MSAQRTSFNNDQSAQIRAISENVQIQTATSSSTTNASTSKTCDEINSVSESEAQTSDKPIKKINVTFFKL